jgi:hypothetical protein
MTEPVSSPPRRRLTRTAGTLLLVLRVYVIVAVPLVAFTFFHSLKP